jgi:hypothetical protein
MRSLSLTIGLILSTSLHAQEGIPGPIIDLSDSQFVNDKLVAAYIERAERENYWDAIDGRFGGQKPLTYYVDLYYQGLARDEALRATEPVSAMLNDALQKEEEIRDKLLNLQGHYNFSVTTIKDFEGQISKLDARLRLCKKSRGRKC